VAPELLYLVDLGTDGQQVHVGAVLQHMVVAFVLRDARQPAVLFHDPTDFNPANRKQPPA